MSVIIRCRACDKPVGWIDTPCIIDDMHIHAYGDMLVDSADIIEDDTGIWFCHVSCREEGDVKRSYPLELRLHMTGSWSDIKYKNKSKLPKKLEKGWK
jgi:hypothetical protein